jgi:hypothetical protein|tara:strand:+ start:743 stop:1354 length:612 start_codon:yes stop_codon:yes gene_type:complete
MGYIGNSPALNESVDTAQLKSPLTGDLAIGGDTDGTDRIFTFGHSTLKSVIGIDDDQDVFAINTDNAFEAANDLEINASGNITVPGTLTSGAITSAAAFTLGSGSQFKEVANGSFSCDAAEEVSYFTPTAGLDGLWMICIGRTASNGFAWGWAARFNNGVNKHVITENYGNANALTWYSDSMGFNQDSGTYTFNYVVYQLEGF